MSFIFGIVHLDSKPVASNHLESLAQGVKWEGFAEQTECGPYYALGYCHRRDRNRKAGIFRCDEVVVLADIRLYNGDALKKWFPFDSPEEAFAKAYLQWGTDCASHLDGDFSVVVIDLRSREVHLFRDPVGTRPLVYLFRENRLIFASHEFGLAKSQLERLSLSKERFICDWFRFRGDYTQTVFREIQKALPGHCTTFLPHRMVSNAYWKPETILQNSHLTFDQAVQGIRQRVVEAVKKRMEPGTTGVHVSGGLDSTAVASVLADCLDGEEQLLGYSWSPETFEGNYEGVDERPYIQAVSAEKGIKIGFLRVEKEEVVQDSLMETFETQSIEHPVMKQAAIDGVTTLFSGWGGDECVSLSKRGVVNHLFFRGKWLSLVAFVRKQGIKASLRLSRSEVLPLLIPLGLLASYASQRTDWSILRLLRPGFIFACRRAIFLHNRKSPFGYGNRKRFVISLLNNNHLAERMESWAIHAERYGFEYKYPLLDKALLEFWFSLPVEYSYHGFASRLLFREAMKGIMPEKVRSRPDKGEGLRMAYTMHNRAQGQEYLLQALLALPEENRPRFVRHDRLLKWIVQKPRKNSLLEFRRLHQPIIYLRYASLIEKYIRPSS